MSDSPEGLRVLITETDSGACDHVARKFEAAGHQVVRCREQGGPAFPCAGLSSEAGCPLEEFVDVAVTVRARPYPKPTPLEDGVTCALRSHVPLVVSGHDGLNPFEAWTRAAATQEDTVETAEWAARAPLIGPTRAATTEARRMVQLLGHEAVDVDAVVRRQGGRLVVDLHLPDTVDQRDASRVAVRVASEIRRTVPRSGQIDVRLA